MIEFLSDNGFQLEGDELVRNWLGELIVNEDYVEGDITYVFCSDDYLHGINKEFLNHDTLTDIITFDYTLGKQIHGEIYVSTDRIADNARTFTVDFNDELHRVMAHGVLHLMGYKDKSEQEAKEMRVKEDKALLTRKFL